MGILFFAHNVVWTEEKISAVNSMLLLFKKGCKWPQPYWLGVWGVWEAVSMDCLRPPDDEFTTETRADLRVAPLLAQPLMLAYRKSKIQNSHFVVSGSEYELGKYILNIQWQEKYISKYLNTYPIFLQEFPTQNDKER